MTKEEASMIGFEIVAYSGDARSKLLLAVEKAKTEIKKMAEKYNNNIIFTLGKDGAVAYENGTIEFIPAMKVDAIETTGAGDSYIGAVSHSIIEGKSLIEACKFATKCSAITVCRMGAQPSMPTLEDVE